MRRLIYKDCVICLTLSILLAFVTPVFSQTEKSDLAIVIVSDINDSYGSASYSQPLYDSLNYIEKLNPDLVFCLGDMVAGQNINLSVVNLQAMWQAFDQTVYQRLTSLNIPFAFTFGNHDGANFPKYAHERKVAVEYWLKHKPALEYVDSGGFPDFYSFNFGPVFFVVIDASAQTVLEKQQEWLKKQFMTRAAQKAEVRVIVGHLPVYALAEGRNKPGNVLANADQMWELFNDLGADYYFSGHHHAFYVSQKGNLKMLSAGALGGGPRRLLNSSMEPVRTLTTLYFPANSTEFKIVTHDMTNNMRLIRSKDLPEEVHGFNGVSKRLNFD